MREVESAVADRQDIAVDRIRAVVDLVAVEVLRAELAVGGEEVGVLALDGVVARLGSGP